MDEQYKDFMLGKSDSKCQASLMAASPTEILTDIATVCVVAGDGLAKIFRSLGASRIVHGGQTMNPSTQDLLYAIEGVSNNNVLVLPNNSDVIMAAHQAKELSSKNVIIIPTRTIPQGISALIAFNYQADSQTNAERMLLATKKIVTIEVTRAIRSGEFNGIQARKGDIIGFLEDKMVSARDSYSRAVLDALQKVNMEDYEILTIYYGNRASEGDARMLVEMINNSYPQLEIEVHFGGQAYYQYIISIE